MDAKGDPVITDLGEDMICLAGEWCVREPEGRLRLVGCCPSRRDQIKRGESRKPMRKMPETRTCWMAMSGVGNLKRLGKSLMGGRVLEGYD